MLAAFRCVLILAALAACAPTPASAQEIGRFEDTRTEGTSYFYFAERGEATVQIYLWGAGRAGIYEIPVGTGLDKLLSMAGGAPVVAEQEGVPPPVVTVRVYRGDDETREMIYEAEVDALVTDRSAYPDLRDNDVVVVESFTPRDFGWREALDIVRTAGTLFVLGLQIYFLSTGRRRR